MRSIDADALINYCNNQKDKTIDANDIARFPTTSGWISVNDRLPDTYKAVITYDKYNGIKETGLLKASPYVSGVKENWVLRASPCISWSQGFHVTHWMPMPEPPKEVEE